MSEEPIVEKKEPTAEDLAKKRVPDPLTPSEKEVYEGKLKEQDETIKKLREEIAELKKVKPVKKPLSIFERFAP
jgi:uncharacterized protein YjgD (DUF1641 family)